MMFPFGVKEVFRGGLQIDGLAVSLDTENLRQFMQACDRPFEEFEIGKYRDALFEFGMQRLVEEIGLPDADIRALFQEVHGHFFGLPGVSLDSYAMQGDRVYAHMHTLFPTHEQWWRVQHKGILEEKGIKVPRPLRGISPTFVDSMVITGDNQTVLGVRTHQSEGAGEIMVAPAGGIEYKKPGRDQEIIMDTVRSETRDEIGLNPEMYTPTLIGIIHDGAIAYGDGFTFALRTQLTFESLRDAHRFAYSVQVPIMQGLEAYGMDIGSARRESHETIREWNDAIARGDHIPTLPPSVQKPILPNDAWEHSELIGLPLDQDTLAAFLQLESVNGHRILEETKGIVYMAQQYLH